MSLSEPLQAFTTLISSMVPTVMRIPGSKWFPTFNSPLATFHAFTGLLSWEEIEEYYARRKEIKELPEVSAGDGERRLTIDLVLAGLVDKNGSRAFPLSPEKPLRYGDEAHDVVCKSLPYPLANHIADAVLVHNGILFRVNELTTEDLVAKNSSDVTP